MAKRRTKQEKLLASLRRAKEINGGETREIQVEKMVYSKPVTTVNKHTSYYTPEISLPTGMLVGDLTKSAVVTILALFLQFALAVYLSKGGWQAVNGMLHSVFSIY